VTQLRKKLLEEIQRRDYSKSTARIYLHVINDFARYFRRSPDLLGPEHIRHYQLHLFHRKLSPYTIRQHTAALRFFYFKTLRRHFPAEYIPFPKYRKRLPTILSPEEVARLIDAAHNLFHRTLIMTLYSTAMRRAELCRLKVTDIDSQRMMIRIQPGKGGRDREVPLSPTLLQTLRVYWRWMKRSKRNVVSETPVAAGVVETGNRRFKELWENRSLVFPQLRQFPQRFSRPKFALRC
jgi:integrase/recombinase XerD